jgi:hypothetical protein
MLEPGLVLVDLLSSFGDSFLHRLTSFLCGIDGCTDGVDFCGVGGLFLHVDVCPKVNNGKISRINNNFFMVIYFIINTSNPF